MRRLWYNTDRERLARPHLSNKLLTKVKASTGKIATSAPGHYFQEDLHLDGSPILHNGGTPPTGRYGTRGHTDDKVEQQHEIGKPQGRNNPPALQEGTGASE